MSIGRKDEIAHTLMRYNINLTGLTDSEKEVVFVQLTEGMNHTEVADIIANTTGKSTIVIQRGSRRRKQTRIRVDDGDSETMNIHTSWTIIHTA